MRERPYRCNACGKLYAQRQGVNRHYREKHDVNSCLYCGANWLRPYQYRDHLEKQHPGIDPDLVLGKLAGSRRKTTVIGREQLPEIDPDLVLDKAAGSHRKATVIGGEQPPAIKHGLRITQDVVKGPAGRIDDCIVENVLDTAGDCATGTVHRPPPVKTGIELTRAKSSSGLAALS